MKTIKINYLISVVLLCTVLSVAAPCQAGMISDQQELQLGVEAARELEAKYGTVNDPGQLERLNRIGRSIVINSERRNQPFTFKILNTDNVNALALPGGFVYVTKALLPLVNDQELAFVLGHEIAHVTKRHGIRQLEKNLWTQAGLVTIVAIANKGQVNEGSMNTVQAVSTVINSKYSRDDETEADLTACYYVVNALGYNPRAGITFMRKLQKLGGSELPGFVNSLVGSHPLTDERIRTIDDACRKLGY
ncbi:MAG: M48 family metalloprotease [Vulcanimicrobiota bacterium]